MNAPAPRRRLPRLATLAPYLALAALIVAASCTSEHFFGARNLLNITRQVSYTGLIALGMAFVIIAGGIDLSVGSGVAFVGGVTLLAMNRVHGALGPEWPWTVFFLGLGVALATGVGGGLVSGWLITRFRIAPFVATLGFMGLYRSLALYLGDGGEFRVASGIEVYADVGAGSLAGIPVPSLVFFGLALLLAGVLHATRFGRHVCAVGSNERVAAYAAISVARVRTLTYAVCGLTVGLAAFLLGGRMNSINPTNAGQYYELDAIAAVVIGGTPMTGGAGSIGGTVAGALMLGIINNMLNMGGVSAYLQGTVKGLVIILAVLVQRPEARDLAVKIFRTLLRRNKRHP